MKHAKMQELGLERIYRLFELAEQELEMHPERAKRYVQLAREISKKVRARFPDELKLIFCKKCNSFLKEGRNAQITRTPKWTLVKCLACGSGRKTGRKNDRANGIGTGELPGTIDGTGKK